MRNSSLFKQHSASLRSRLLLAAAVWLLVMTTSASYIVPNFIKTYLVNQETQQLSLYLDQLSGLINIQSNGSLFIEGVLSNPRFQTPYSGLYWVIQSKHQTLRSRSLWDSTIKKDDDQNYIGPDHQTLLLTQRIIYLPDHEQAVDLRVAINENRLVSTIESMTHGLWLILVIMALGILALIWLQVSWSLLPLQKLQINLKKMRDGDNEQLSGKYPTEVMPLIDDLNALVFHYQELLLRARNHAGNLSHALKTPISILNNEVSLLDQDHQARLLPALNQLQQHIDYHLGRARMAGAANILSAKCAPSMRVDAISLAMDKIYADRNILLVNELDSDLFVNVEKSDLDEIIGNLIENSYKWAKSLVRVHLKSQTETKATIVIEDDGMGIDEKEFETVLQRGMRLDETTPGTGLGMNIVHELVHSYRGVMELSRSQLGGLRVTLILPKAKS